MLKVNDDQVQKKKKKVEGIEEKIQTSSRSYEKLKTSYVN
jgi:hypothetical protein